MENRTFAVEADRMQGTATDSWRDFAEALTAWIDDPNATEEEARRFAAKAVYLASTWR